MSHPPRLQHLTTATAVVALAAFVTLASPVASAGTSVDTNAGFDTAFAQFQQALNGQSSAIEGAAAQWLALSGAQPADPVLRAYAGAATAMKANSTWMPWRKMSHAEDGLAMIDKALAMLDASHDAPAHRKVPASLETRFVAANTFLGLPSMFNRGARGAKLMADVANSPLLHASPAEFKANVWLSAGEAAAKDKRLDEARQWLQKAAASGTTQGQAAQARLKVL